MQLIPSKNKTSCTVHKPEHSALNNAWVTGKINGHDEHPCQIASQTRKIKLGIIYEKGLELL